jgi:hypothetical protein
MKLSKYQLQILLKILNICIPNMAPLVDETELSALEEIKHKAQQELENDSN